jgi:hypothetical protein
MEAGLMGLLIVMRRKDLRDTGNARHAPLGDINRGAILKGAVLHGEI